MPPHRIIAAAALVAAALVAGCGDDEDPGSAQDQEAVRKVVTDWARSTASPVTCTTVFTTKLVTEIYGGRSECVRKVSDDDDEQPLRDVAVSGISVDGSKATAELRGRTEQLRIEGEVRLAKQGSAWRIDGYGDDFIRGVLTQVVTVGIRGSLDENKITGASELVEGANLESCAEDRFSELPPEQARRIAYSVLGGQDDDASGARLRTTIADCLKASEGGREILLKIAEAGISERLGSRGPCVVGKLRATVREELEALAAAGVANRPIPQAARAKVNEEAQTAARTCGAQQSG